MALREMSAQTWGCGLTCSVAFAGGLEVRMEMRTSWIRVVQNPVTGRRHGLAGRGHVRTEVEVGGRISSQQEQNRLRSDFLPVLRRNQPCPHLNLDLWPPEL